MSHVTLIRDDGHVYVDGVARRVDLSALPASFHALQYDTAAGAGHTEDKASGNAPLGRDGFEAAFRRYVDAWQKAAD